MAYTKIKYWLENEINNIQKSGLYKKENILTSSQSTNVDTTDGEKINFCANNYLGLADNTEIINTVKNGIDNYGFGMASVRFICGTQDIHKNLEDQISNFLGTEDTILYNSCFDANTGLFETILNKEDAVISDELNHASIIDGIRLCKADRKRYKHNDMKDLEEQLSQSMDKRFRLIATDGVFSMQGDLAPLNDICDLAEKYDSMVMVDDSHATGFLGPNGAGTADQLNVRDRVDITTSTLGKALGGSYGGFTIGKKEIVEYLRQKSRPYLFSNTLASPIVIGASKSLEMVTSQPERRKNLMENTSYFRNKMSALGFEILPGIHPIVPIMLRDEIKTVKLAELVNNQGILVVGFSYPVVPLGEARIRVQLSAIHTKNQLDKAITIFEKSAKELSII